jgi:hypothetical protein
MLKQKEQSKWNLEHWQKINGKWHHISTPTKNVIYAIAKGQKIKHEVNKKHFEFYKITENGNRRTQ